MGQDLCHIESDTHPRLEKDLRCAFVSHVLKLPRHVVSPFIWRAVFGVLSIYVYTRLNLLYTYIFTLLYSVK